MKRPAAQGHVLSRLRRGGPCVATLKYKNVKLLHMVAEIDEMSRQELVDSGNTVPSYIALETPQDCTVSLTVEGRCTGFPKEEAWHSCRRRALSAHLSDIHQDHGARRAHQHVRTHQQLGDPQA